MATSKRTSASSGRAGTGRTTPRPSAGHERSTSSGSERERGIRPRRPPRQGQASTRPRRTPGIASSLGAAFALSLISLFTQIPWAVKVALVATALLGIAGYVTVHVVHMFDEDNVEEPDDPPGTPAPAASTAASTDAAPDAPSDDPDAPSDDKDAAQ